MNDPHPLRAECGQKQRHRAVLLRISPEHSAHTTAERPFRAPRLVKIPSLNLRGEFLWRGGPPLAAPLVGARKNQLSAEPELRLIGYLISTLAPASSNFFLIAAASSLLTPSLTVLGAPSTRSLASFKPRLVTSRTTLMTATLFSPNASMTTLNSVFSSTGAAAPAAAAGPAATATGAAAETPHFSSSAFTRSTISMIGFAESASINSAFDSAMTSYS